MPRLAIAARRVEGLSGAVRLVLAEARAAAAAGWEVHVLAERVDAEAVRAAGAVPRRVPRWPWGSWLKRRAFAALAGRSARGFDLVHGHGDLLGQDLLSLHNCVHAAREAAGGALPASDATGRMHAAQLSGRLFRRLAANSRLMKEDAVRRFGVPAALVDVVYPGFDPARLRPADRARLGPARRAALGLPADAVVFGLVTSGDFGKRGLPAFLRAFAAVSRDVPAARALVVGKETRPGPYLRLAGELGIADLVAFRAPVPDVESLYHALDVYVHAAAWEEFGMTALEAAACGVPVLCGARVGAAEVLAGEARAGVVEAPTPEALAAAMRRLAGDAGARGRAGAACAAAAAPLTLEAHGRAVLSLYEGLLNK